MLVPRVIIAFAWGRLLIDSGDLSDVAGSLCCDHCVAKRLESVANDAGAYRHKDR